jgi:hypothetical protein
MSKRFTLAVATGIADRCSLSGKGHALLTVLRAAEAANDAARQEQAERDERQQQLMQARDELAQFSKAMRAALNSWRGLSPVARAQLAAEASVRTGKSWMVDGAPPVGIYETPDSDAVAATMGHAMLHASDIERCAAEFSGTIAFPAQRPVELPGLRAVVSILQAFWIEAAGAKWNPRWKPVARKRAAIPANDAAKLMHAVGTRLDYTATNCASVTGYKTPWPSAKRP